MEPSIRVLCVDDHGVVLDGLSLIINRQPDMKVVAVARTNATAIALYEQTRPHVTLMDLELAGADGIGTIRAIRQRDPRARIVVLTMHHDAESIYRALEAGAATYVLKDTISKALIQVIREVHAGERPMVDAVTARLSERASRPALTDREVQVLSLLMDGLSNKRIASALSLSVDTVRSHLKNIFKKLGVGDRTAAVTVALRCGVLHLTPR